MSLLNQGCKTCNEFWQRFHSRIANALIAAAFTFGLYVLFRPTWISRTSGTIIGFLLVIIAVWFSDVPSRKLMVIGVLWVLLLSFWYCFHPGWFSIGAAIIVGALITLLAYGVRRAKPQEVSTSELEPWDTERQKLLLEAWKQTVAVQMHFNDLELRIRNFAITLLLAAGGGAAYSLKEKIFFTLPGGNTDTHVSVLILSFGLLGWIAFYLMDRFWYHKLLYGAVNHGRLIEEKFGDVLSFLRLTGAIGQESSMWFLGLRVRSSQKIDAFYLLFALVQIAAIYVAYTTVKPTP